MSDFGIFCCSSFMKNNCFFKGLNHQKRAVYYVSLTQKFRDSLCRVLTGQEKLEQNNILGPEKQVKLRVLYFNNF